VGALQTEAVVSQDPQRRERGKETAALWRPSIRSLGALRVAEGKFKIWVEIVGVFLRRRLKLFALYSQTFPRLSPCPFPSLKWE